MINYCIKPIKLANVNIITDELNCDLLNCVWLGGSVEPIDVIIYN